MSLFIDIGNTWYFYVGKNSVDPASKKNMEPRRVRSSKFSKSQSIGIRNDLREHNKNRINHKPSTTKEVKTKPRKLVLVFVIAVIAVISVLGLTFLVIYHCEFVTIKVA